MVYYYGWDRMKARTHVAVGWVYFIAAWISLVIINGILSYMLTPGAWVTNRAFWSGFFNPTYWPSMIMRTFVAMGLAGIDALLTASWSGNPVPVKQPRHSPYRNCSPIPLPSIPVVRSASRARSCWGRLNRSCAGCAVTGSP